MANIFNKKKKVETPKINPSDFLNEYGSETGGIQAYNFIQRNENIRY